MKNVLLSLIAVIFVLSGCNAATGIEISQAWARPALQGNNGAVYFLLQNHSAFSDELTGASADIAESATLHESKMEGDVMQMRPVTTLPIGGKESIAFAPGSYHVMLAGLKQELKAGDEIQITLHFKNHEDILLAVPVQETAPGDLGGD